MLLSSRKYDPGCSSRIRIRILIFTHPGSRILGSKRHRILDPEHCMKEGCGSGRMYSGSGSCLFVFNMVEAVRCRTDYCVTKVGSGDYPGSGCDPDQEVPGLDLGQTKSCCIRYKARLLT